MKKLCMKGIQIYFGIDLIVTCALLFLMGKALCQMVSDGVSGGIITIMLVLLPMLLVYIPCTLVLIGAAVSLALLLIKKTMSDMMIVVLAASIIQILVCVYINPPISFFYGNALTPFQLQIGVQIIMVVIRLLFLLFYKLAWGKGER